MKRALLAIASTIAGLIMLLSFKTQSTTTSLAAPPAVSTPSATASSGSTPSSSASATPKTGTTKTYTGTAADTRYGPVQVAITVKNGTVTAVTAVEYPQSDPRDQQINSYAIPQLNSEALTAKSSHIDMVSGATYTSTGYTTSLQSALDEAGL